MRYQPRIEQNALALDGGKLRKENNYIKHRNVLHEILEEACPRQT